MLSTFALIGRTTSHENPVRRGDVRDERRGGWCYSSPSHNLVRIRTKGYQSANLDLLLESTPAILPRLRHAGQSTPGATVRLHANFDSPQESQVLSFSRQTTGPHHSNRTLWLGHQFSL